MDSHDLGPPAFLVSNSAGGYSDGSWASRRFLPSSALSALENEASLNWKPVDYVLFGLNYAHIKYGDAALALPGGDRNYSVNVVGVRSQVDF